MIQIPGFKSGNLHFQIYLILIAFLLLFHFFKTVMHKQILRPDHITCADDCCPLYQIFQFLNISRPWIIVQTLVTFPVKLLVLPGFIIVLVQEEVKQRNNVLPAFP